MYYKIENKDCEVYKKLHQMRTKELQMEEDNIKSIEEKTGLKFTTYLGHPGQQNFRRTTQYIGFKFTEPEKVDPKIWTQCKQHPEIFVPNRRTKKGREMNEFLSNGLEGSFFDKPLEILGLPGLGKFTIPFIEIFGDCIYLFLSDNHEPSDENVIEITKHEFHTAMTKKELSKNTQTLPLN